MVLTVLSFGCSRVFFGAYLWSLHLLAPGNEIKKRAGSSNRPAGSPPQLPQWFLEGLQKGPGQRAGQNLVAILTGSPCIQAAIPTTEKLEWVEEFPVASDPSAR